MHILNQIISLLQYYCYSFSYSFTLFHFHIACFVQELDDEQMAATDDPSIPVDAPTLSEVQSAIKKLKLGRASRDGEVSSHVCLFCPT